MIHMRLKLKYSGFALEVDLQLPGRGVTALYGHSGSGKTTCLRCIAGLEKAEQGFIQVNDEVWQDSDKKIFVPPHKRALGYVFQEASLFPHLSVLANLEFGLKRIPRPQRRVDMTHATELLGIGHLLDRHPQHLSGGERQRVGIARALLTSPKLLLMDEPLAALDSQRKNEILPYLQRLHDELDIPVLYVSHSQDEVARLADHLVLLSNGKALASGSSISNSFGLVSRARAMPTRCRSPPERCCGWRSSKWPIPSSSVTCAMSTRRCWRGVRLRPNCRLASTDRWGNRLASWKT